MKKARPRVGGAVSDRGIRCLEGVRHSRWHGAASSALVSRSRAMPAGGRPAGSKPSPRFFAVGDAISLRFAQRCRCEAPTGRTGRPWQHAIRVVGVPTRLHFGSNWPEVGVLWPGAPSGRTTVSSRRPHPNPGGCAAPWEDSRRSPAGRRYGESGILNEMSAGPMNAPRPVNNFAASRLAA